MIVRNLRLAIWMAGTLAQDLGHATALPSPPAHSLPCPSNTGLSCEGRRSLVSGPRLKAIRIGKASDPSPTAYVQFHLDVAGPFVTIE